MELERMIFYVYGAELKGLRLKPNQSGEMCTFSIVFRILMVPKRKPMDML